MSYYEKNKEKVKQYYIQNKERIRERQQIYEKGKGKEKIYLRQREYRLEHKDHFNELERKRYDKQKRHEKHLKAYKVRERKTKTITKPVLVLPPEQKEHFKKKWEERQRKEELKSELKKIRTEHTYEKDGKLFYNFYILRRLREFKSTFSNKECF